MASWSETHGLEGISKFMYAQSDEERVHMLKVMKFINERGGHAQVTELKRQNELRNISEMFEELYKHEVFVSNAINELVHIALLKRIMRHITFTMVRRRTN
jgi:ferritin